MTLWHGTAVNLNGVRVEVKLSALLKTVPSATHSAAKKQTQHTCKTKLLRSKPPTHSSLFLRLTLRSLRSPIVVCSNAQF